MISRPSPSINWCDTLYSSPRVVVFPVPNKNPGRTALSNLAPLTRHEVRPRLLKQLLSQLFRPTTDRTRFLPLKACIALAERDFRFLQLLNTSDVVIRSEGTLNKVRLRRLNFPFWWPPLRQRGLGRHGLLAISMDTQCLRGFDVCRKN